MSKIEISKEVARKITFMSPDEEFEGFKVIECGDWICDGKYDYMTTIFEKDGKFYELEVSRSGSPFGEYSWCWEWENTFKCAEVEKKEVISYKWIRKE